MRIFIVLLILLKTTFSFAQTQVFSKVYIVEGLVIDAETSQVVPSAILYNDSLGIATTTDENGYFKIVVPVGLVKSGTNVQINVVKTGYKLNRTWFGYNPFPADTIANDNDSSVLYNSDVPVFQMAKNSSSLISTSGIHSPVKEGEHGAAMIRQTYNEMIASEQRQKKFDRLKQGNDKVYFPLNGGTGLVTRLYDIIVIGRLTYVYIDGRKVKLIDINKAVKRSAVFYDRLKSDSLSKACGKEIVALRTTPPPGVSKERLNAPIKATLEIDLEN